MKACNYDGLFWVVKSNTRTAEVFQEAVNMHLNLLTFINPHLQKKKNIKFNLRLFLEIPLSRLIIFSFPVISALGVTFGLTKF